MLLQDRINSFVRLGNFLTGLINDQSPEKKKENGHFADFNKLIRNINKYNPWFTENFVRYSLAAISEVLKFEKISSWLKEYPELEKESKISKKIGIIMAGNITLVGFFDMLSVLISGNIFIGKLSTKDNELLRMIADYLISVNHEFKNYIFFEDERLKDFDAIIATGSNNTSRYFKYYFGKYPHIIRKNRNSVAILDGKESSHELKNLANDIFIYFGLGCRNVAKLYIPKAYNFNCLFEAFESYSYVYNHNKFANNYDYNRAILLMNKIPFLENGFIILKEDEKFPEANAENAESY